MSCSKLSVAALLVLLPGVVAGWGCWYLVYPWAERLLLGNLGVKLGVLVLWLLLGAAMLSGYWVALRVGARYLRADAGAGTVPGSSPAPGR